MPSDRQILQRELAEKLRLEESLKPGIRRIFRRVLDEFKASVARTGRPQSVARYAVSFETLLEDHYRKVAKAFKGAVLAQNNASSYAELKQAEEDDQTEELIAAILLLWADGHAPIQAGIITTTTEMDMQDAINRARASLLEQGLPTDPRSLAAAATPILKRILNNRVDLITVTETQTSAEMAKQVEAYTAAGAVVPGLAVPPAVGLQPRPAAPKLKKSWLDLRDDRTRETHLIAGRRYQESPIPITETFVVGGFRMMIPGDTSMGAPIREIANCRCSARYFIG
jgi:hypothetical protein